MLARGEVPLVRDLARLPIWAWGAGLLGAVFVFSILYAIPKIGALPAMILAVFGQLIAALIIDHFGLFNLPKLPISPLKLLGILLIMCGFALASYKS